MATIPAGTPVALLDEYEDALAFPPPPEAVLYIAAHDGALRAGVRNLLTQLVAVEGHAIAWVGALDERMLTVLDDPPLPEARLMLSWYLDRGAMWNIIWPGELARRPGEELYTVYRVSRPWVILGELEDGSPLAAPLNDATHPTWFTPVIEAHDILLPNAKRCQLELAHLWSFPPGDPVAGSISRGARLAITEALRTYFVA
jgi:hypothetical protein